MRVTQALPLPIPMQDKEFIQDRAPGQLGGAPLIAASGRTCAGPHTSLPGDNAILTGVLEDTAHFDTLHP